MPNLHGQSEGGGALAPFIFQRERASLLLAGAVPADSCCHPETAMVPEEHMVLTPYTCLDTGLGLRMQIEICRHAAIGSVLNQEVD